MNGPMETAIRPAVPAEAPTISTLAIRSKAHWGYTPERMAVFGLELTIAPEQIVPRRTHVLTVAGALRGFYTLKPRGRGVLELEHLFVDPAYLRRGYGTALFRHACRTAAAAGCRKLGIQSDPHAAGFYRKQGAQLIREIPSSIRGRSLPWFELTPATASADPSDCSAGNPDPPIP
jgi:GNAT superfamily N-acetyltransferase